jgi:hypothetical protein
MMGFGSLQASYLKQIEWKGAVIFIAITPTLTLETAHLDNNNNLKVT